MIYDYLVVGAGLFGSTFAYEAAKLGKSVLVIDSRNHIGGNIYTENIAGINVHKYGAHIFHTNDRYIWDYVNQFAEFNNFINSPIARYKNEIYNLPFNMNTFSKMWGISTPEEARNIIEAQIREAGISNPKNLEEQAIYLVGYDLYNKLVKGYTEKQWGRDAKELPSFIIKRLPIRYTYNNNYFNDKYQGIPQGGYTQIIEKMLDQADVILNADFYDDVEYYKHAARKIIFTGSIDKYFDYSAGMLEYRSLRFETEILSIDNYQGNAVVNYTDFYVPYTRIIEHKHFEPENYVSDKTIITKEYPATYNENAVPYYSINDVKNNILYEEYLKLAKNQCNVVFGGRLGAYKYYDMDDTIISALKLIKLIK